MLVSYDCFLETASLNMFGSSKHLLKVFVSCFIPVIMFLIALVVFSLIKMILCGWIMYLRWMSIAIITILFNLYSNTASLILSIFNCKTIEDDIWLVRDLDLICWKGSHSKWAFMFGIPMIIFFIFGLPILGILLLTLRWK